MLITKLKQPKKLLIVLNKSDTNHQCNEKIIKKFTTKTKNKNFKNHCFCLVNDVKLTIKFKNSSYF